MNCLAIGIGTPGFCMNC